MTSRCALLMMAFMLLLFPAFAVEPEEILDDPILEERARELSANLRCLVCQNQSIDDSDAELAKDLRVIVRERLVAGDTNKEVIEFVVDRYGEFVLLRPSLSAQNILLWATPILVLLLGAAFALSATRRSEKARSVTNLSEDELARVEALLDNRDSTENR